MPITSYSADLPSDCLLDSGVLYVGSNIVGVSRGGLSFDPGRTWRNTEFDGKRSPVKGLDRIAGFASKIAGTMLEFGTEELPQFEPGSTSDSGTPTNTFTPKAAGVVLSSGDYLTNVRLVFERGNGKYAAVLFAVGLVTEYSLKGQDNSEAEVQITIEARLDITGGAVPGTCPYKIELRDALP